MEKKRIFEFEYIGKTRFFEHPNLNIQTRPKIIRIPIVKGNSSTTIVMYLTYASTSSKIKQICYLTDTNWNIMITDRFRVTSEDRRHGFLYGSLRESPERQERQVNGVALRRQNKCTKATNFQAAGKNQLLERMAGSPRATHGAVCAFGGGRPGWPEGYCITRREGGQRNGVDRDASALPKDPLPTPLPRQ